MNNDGTPRIPLRELIVKSEDRVSVKTDGEYPNFGIYSFGRGLFEKPAIQGSHSSAITLYRATSDQFVYSRLFAFEGAYDVVPARFHGYFVSNEFPLFTCDPTRLLPSYLGWYFRNPTIWPEVARLTTGMGNRRQRIQPDAFLSFAIPLPSLEKQRQIAALIERLAAKANQARELRRRSSEQLDELCRAILRDQRFGATKPTPMRELITWRKPDVEVIATNTYQFAGVYCFGRGVFQGQRRTGAEFAYKQLTQIRAGEFIYPKLMAWEGALAVVPAECDGLYVSPEFPVFTINEDRVFPEVLDVYFRSPAVWPRLSSASTGTNVRRKRLNPSDFLEYQFPLPAREAQILLRKIRRKMLDLHSLRNQTAQLNALIPSILDRAFKGAM